MSKSKGCIVEESLEDNRILNNIEIVKVRITSDDAEEERWHIYDAFLSESDIDLIHRNLKQAWFMHIWNENKMIVLFRDRRFDVEADNKKTWMPAIEYGLSLGIPKEQLEFLKEF